MNFFTIEIEDPIGKGKKVESSKTLFETNSGWSVILVSTYIVGDEWEYANKQKSQ